MKLGTAKLPERLDKFHEELGTTTAKVSIYPNKTNVKLVGKVNKTFALVGDTFEPDTVISICEVIIAHSEETSDD